MHFQMRIFDRQNIFLEMKNSTFTRFKEKDTITRYVNITGLVIPFKKQFDQSMLISETAC